MADDKKNNEEIIKKVKLSLGIFYSDDKNLITQVEQHINSAIHFFKEVKGIDKTLLESESGILLITIYVNDVWRENGKFEFSPATEMTFNSLMDETALLKHKGGQKNANNPFG